MRSTHALQGYQANGTGQADKHTDYLQSLKFFLKKGNADKQRKERCQRVENSGETAVEVLLSGGKEHSENTASHEAYHSEVFPFTNLYFSESSQ